MKFPWLIISKPTAAPAPKDDRPRLTGIIIEGAEFNGEVVKYKLYLTFNTGRLFIAANAEREPLEAIATEMMKELGL